MFLFTNIASDNSNSTKNLAADLGPVLALLTIVLAKYLQNGHKQQLAAWAELQ
jgi:hypothetical protein